MLFGFTRVVWAHSEDCKKTAELVDQFDYAITSYDNVEQLDKEIKKKIDDNSAAPGDIILSCIRLKVQRFKASKKLPDVLAWHPFVPNALNESNRSEEDRADYWKNPREDFYSGCMRSSCTSFGAVAELLRAVCLERGGNERSCSNRLVLSTTRKVVGWSLVGAGAIAVILGAVNLGVPIARGSGCTDYGLELPCVADRRILSGLLLGLGLGSIGGGTLTLTLPVGSRK